jgi:hypothetical protein
MFLLAGLAFNDPAQVVDGNTTSTYFHITPHTYYGGTRTNWGAGNVIAFKYDFLTSMYITSFKLYNDTGDPADGIRNFQLDIYDDNNALISTITDIGPGSTTPATYALPTPITVSNGYYYVITISSQYGTGPGTGGGMHWREMDFIGTTSLPVSCDIDSDGIPNYLDLDSDADGCADAVEGGAAFDNGDLVSSSMPGGSTSIASTLCITAGCVDASGVPTIADSPQSAGTSQNSTAQDANCVICTPPTISAPTVTQPTCSVTTGTIVVNATGIGTLEYTVDNGTTWGASNTFAGLAAGTYNIVVREQANPACTATYSGNPITLTAATGCPVCGGTTANDDYDCDGVINSIDLDDDNDGILDTDEVFCISSAPLGSYDASQFVPVVDPTPAGNTQTYGPVTITYKELSGTSTAWGVSEIDLDATGSSVQYDFSDPLMDIEFVISDLDAQEVLNLRFYDELGAIIDLAPYVSFVGANGSITAAVGQSTQVVTTVCTNSASLIPTSSVRFYVPVLVSKIEVDFVSRCVVGSPELYIANACYPLDTDGDGIPDKFDLDSDADGCADAIEGGASFANGDLVTSTIPGGSTNVQTNLCDTPLCIDANGVPTIAGSPQTVGTSQNSTVQDADCSSCTAPTVSAPTVTQPTCSVTTGTIVVNATGAGTLEYSVDNGTTWVASNTFASLAAGTYNIAVREQADPACTVTYSGNPVTLTAATGCSVCGGTTANDDYDCDGVINSIDLDDDNDGILDTVECEASVAVSNTTDWNPIGDASTAGTELIITPNLQGQRGASWYNNQVSINQAFNYKFQANLGADDNGADGIAFVISTDPRGTNAIGENGWGLGVYDTYTGDGCTSTYQSGGSGCRNGVWHSLVIEMDTYHNGNDFGDLTSNDHLSIQNNSNAGQIWDNTYVDMGNIEDGLWHDVEVDYDGTVLKVYFDNVLKITTTTNISADFLGGATTAYIGYTSSTGSNINLQQIRPISFSMASGSCPDTDNDGTTNNFDLDSDGDTCSDANEAGTTTSTTANFQFSTVSTDNGANGFFNALETSTESGLYNGTYTYSNATNLSITTCPNCTPPTINAPTVTQPNCTVATGTIVVSATGTNTLEYSVDNGTTWSASNTFAGLAAGTYNVVVREQANPACTAAYSGNPLTLTAATGCCNGGDTSSTGDFDCDGVANSTDLDDDNDGILDTSEQTCGTFTTNHKLNGGISVFRDNSSTFSIIAGIGSDNNVDEGGTAAGNNNTNYYVAYGTQDESIVQTFDKPVSQVIINNVKHISGSGSTNTELFEVYINGTFYPITAAMLTGLSANSFITASGAIGGSTTAAYTSFTKLTISIPNGITSIRVRSNPNGTSALNGFAVESIEAVYCEIDTDGDGIYDRFDLDSDADGCADAIEGGASFANGDLVTSTIPGGSTNVQTNLCDTPLCVDANGVPTIAGSPQTLGTSQDSTTIDIPNCAICTTPTVSTPTVTQPTCSVTTGTIVVNATGTNTLEYSVDNGTTWSASNTFAGLAAGTYNVVVREQANPACTATYSGNPLTLTAATGCDSDGDGVTNAQELIDGTDPNDSCDLTLASVTILATSTGDCDGDGVTNAAEINGPDNAVGGGDGTDPNDACDFNASQITLALTTTADCDGDGVTNAQELIDGTDPNDSCDLTLISVTILATSTGDCDGDGVTNAAEINGPDSAVGGGDGTEPNDACDFNASQVTILATNTGDCDGDGVTNAAEINGPDSAVGGGDGTDPSDACDFNASQITVAVTSTADCDGDGVTNAQELIDGTDPNDSCDLTLSSVTVLATSTGDCDGDGVTNAAEINGPDNAVGGGDGTDPNDACDFNASQITLALTSTADCDGDGVTNAQELIDGTDPNDSCDLTLSSVTVLATSTGDCDGDGVTNAAEINGPDSAVGGGDGTDPNDACDFNASQITVAVTSTADCDGDGVTNAQELIDGTDPNDSCDLTLASVTILATSTGDCDGDGVTNAAEINGPDNAVGGGDGTDPNDACDFNASQITVAVTSTADCDGDGVTNAQELIDGTDPNDSCDLTLTSVTILATSTGDCDGDGVTNAAEINGPDSAVGGGDGTDPNDACDFNASQITAAVTSTADCDGDGVTNAQELIDGTDPNDSCDLTLTSVTILATSTGDCDGDGVTNAAEINGPDSAVGGGDGTDPNDACDFNASQITAAVTSTADCDGDGVTNAQELIDGTDPNDSCDLTLSSVTVLATSTGDCDGDGVTNAAEINGPDNAVGGGDGTDPNDACDFNASQITAAVTSTADCDGDGVTNAQELIDGTDPNDSCDLTLTSVTLLATSTGDCDGDGVTNAAEINGPDNAVGGGDGTDPNDACDFNASQITLAVTSTADCDGDGVTNAQELIDGTDPNDSCDLTLTSVTILATSTGDCDGDGVTNAAEINGPDNAVGGGDGTDPNDACDFNASQITVAVTSTADCDGDGVTNAQELIDGTDPNDSCDLTLASVTILATSTGDCDGDGVTNAAEINGPDNAVGGGDGTDPNDACDFNASQITAAVTSTADCDGDGVTNAQELIDGTDPNDSCDLTLTSVTILATSTGDCDGDGVTNAAEINGPDNAVGGGDGTDPNDACDFNATQVTILATSTGDCDGDGVTNAAEINGPDSAVGGGDGTDPNDACDFNASQITIAVTSTGDCDGDGNPNVTDPNDLVPTAVDDAGTAPIGTTTSINILGNDDFLANDGNTITQAGGTAAGLVSFDPITGTLLYTPLLSEAGTVVTVIYEVCQGTVCDQATVTITVPAPVCNSNAGVITR